MIVSRPAWLARAASVVVTGACLVSAPGGSAIAQGESVATGVRPGWLPREFQWSNMTAAQRATAMTTLERLEGLLLRIPGLAKPHGFEIVPQFAGGYRPLGPDDVPLPNGVVRYNVGLMMFAPSKQVAGEGRVCVSMIVNDGPLAATHRDSRGRQIYIEAARGAPMPPATQVYGGLSTNAGERSSVSALFTSGSSLPWTSVTREEFVDALIVDVEGKDGAKKAELQAKLAKTPYQEWTEGTTQRKRDRDETIAQARQVQSPAEVEKLRQTLEASEREVTERLRKDDGATRERFAEARTGLDGYGTELRASLAAMTPEERKMPAYVDNALSAGPMVAGYRLSQDAAPPAWRVLTPNWEFWRAHRAPVEVHSIEVHMGGGGTCLTPAIQRALRQAFERLDWRVVHALLEEPRQALSATQPQRR